jgi:S-DNA-T family DNA segregation ATPase FtsK/SpoIIIE
MLFIGNGVSKPRRIQGCFISDEEIEALNNYLRQKGDAEYDDAIMSFRSAQGSSGAMGGDGSGEDDLYNEAMETVMNAGKASASLLQRRLRVGYARAARLLDILEEHGVIGPADGARPRDILISDTGSEAFQPKNDGVSDYDSGQNDDYNKN